MNRYQTAPLTVGLALLFVFSSIQTESARGFELGPFGSGWLQTSQSGSVGLGTGIPITASWSIVPDGTDLPGFHLATGQSNDPSSLLARLDGIHGAGTGGTDLTQRPWFSLFESSFARFDELSGLNYVYEPEDDGLVIAGDFGLAGVRGDTRIGGHPLSGGIGAYATFPVQTGGDIVFNTNQGFFDDSTGDYLRFRNVLMHEIGHALGLKHVSVGSAIFLMNQGVPDFTVFEGPQIDDILGLQRLYGDANELEGIGNETPADATPLGTLLPGTPIAIGTDVSTTDLVTFDQVDFLTIDDDTDTDVFSFTLTSSSLVDIQLAPQGPRYQVGPEGDTPSFYDALGQSDLNLELLDSDGTTVLSASDINGLANSVSGAAGDEEILGFLLTPGEYFVRVQGGGQDAIQLFQLDLSATAAIPEPTSVLLMAVAVLCLPCGRRARRQ